MPDICSRLSDLGFRFESRMGWSGKAHRSIKFSKVYMGTFIEGKLDLDRTKHIADYKLHIFDENTVTVKNESGVDASLAIETIIDFATEHSLTSLSMPF